MKLLPTSDRHLTKVYRPIKHICQQEHEISKYPWETKKLLGNEYRLQYQNWPIMSENILVILESPKNNNVMYLKATEDIKYVVYKIVVQNK